MTEAMTTQERYASSIQSSSLRVEAHVRGDADFLIAAGWCKSRFGAALMRLQAEWDGAERWGVKIPVRPTKRAITAEARVKFEPGTKRVKGEERPTVIRKITADSMKDAREKLEARYEAEMERAFSALKTLPDVTRDFEIKLRMDGHDDSLAAAILLYWLDPRCKVCHGTGLQAKSERGCGKCREHPGLASAPGGEPSKALFKFLTDCASRAGAETRGRCQS